MIFDVFKKIFFSVSVLLIFVIDALNTSGLVFFTMLRDFRIPADFWVSFCTIPRALATGKETSHEGTARPALP